MKKNKLNKHCCSVTNMSNSLWPHGLQHARLPYPSLSPRVCSNSCPLSRFCYLTITSSVAPFSFSFSLSQHQSLFPVSQLFTAGGQSIGASASTALPMNIQGCFPLGWTDLISLPSKGLSKVFSSPTIQKHQFFSTQLSWWSISHIPTWLLGK